MAVEREAESPYGGRERVEKIMPEPTDLGGAAPAENLRGATASPAAPPPPSPPPRRCRLLRPQARSSRSRAEVGVALRPSPVPAPRPRSPSGPRSSPRTARPPCRAPRRPASAPARQSRPAVLLLLPSYPQGWAASRVARQRTDCNEFWP